VLITEGIHLFCSIFKEIPLKQMLAMVFTFLCSSLSMADQKIVIKPGSEITIVPGVLTTIQCSASTYQPDHECKITQDVDYDADPIHKGFYVLINGHRSSETYGTFKEAIEAAELLAKKRLCWFPSVSE